MAAIAVPTQLVKIHDVFGEMYALLWIIPVVPATVAIIGLRKVRYVSRIGSVRYKADRVFASSVVFWIAMSITWIACYFITVFLYIGIAG